MDKVHKVAAVVDYHVRARLYHLRDVAVVFLVGGVVPREYVQTVMNQCELWTDNADLTDPSHKAHPATEYNFNDNYGALKIADEN